MRSAQICENSADSSSYRRLAALSFLRFQTVIAKPAHGKLGVGLQVLAGDALLIDVYKDGKPVRAKVTVTDAAGAEKASKVGSLSAFGFS